MGEHAPWVDLYFGALYSSVFLHALLPFSFSTASVSLRPSVGRSAHVPSPTLLALQHCHLLSWPPPANGLNLIACSIGGVLWSVADLNTCLQWSSQRPTDASSLPDSDFLQISVCQRCYCWVIHYFRYYHFIPTYLSTSHLLRRRIFSHLTTMKDHTLCLIDRPCLFSWMSQSCPWQLSFAIPGPNQGSCIACACCVSLVSFNFRTVTQALCSPLWHWHCWRVQASDFVKRPSTCISLIISSWLDSSQTSWSRWFRKCSYVLFSVSHQETCDVILAHNR